MLDEKTIAELFPYRTDEPKPPVRHRVISQKENFLRRYGIMLILWAAFTIYTICLSAFVNYQAVQRTRAEYDQMFESWQQEYTADQYLLTGEASRAAAIDRDAVSIAHDGGIWKTEAAFKAYVWNVVVRSRRSNYPNSVQEVLEQTGQYAFYDPDGTYNAQKVQWAKEVLEEAYDGQLPRYLTLEHQFLEMRNGGEDCILHTCFDFNTMNDDPWRYRE